MVANSTLKSKSITSIFWSVFEKIGHQGIQFVVSIILARLLDPEEFGVIAMLYIFMAISQVLIDGGFGQAIIQKQDASHEDECSIFYFNVIVSFCLAAILFFSSSKIASFYQVPIISPIAKVMSLNFIINAFGIIQTSLLFRTLRLKVLFFSSVIASIIAGIISISMALHNLGVWSLVALSVSSNFFRTLLLWVMHSWRPSLSFRFSSLAAMVSYSVNILMANMLEAVYQNIYLVIIGKMFSASSLGYYSRAERLQQLPTKSLTLAVDRVLFPMFSIFQDDKKRLKQNASLAITILSLINMPLMIGVAVCAENIITVVLTEKWSPAIPYLQLFCVLGILYPLHVVNLNLLKSQGRADLFFRVDIVKKLILVLVVIITYRWGIVAMIYGQIFSSILGYFINTYYSKKMINYSLFAQLKDIVPVFSAAALMGIAVYYLSILVPFSPVVELMFQIITGILIFVVLSFSLRIKPFLFIIDNLKEIKSA